MGVARPKVVEGSTGPCPCCGSQEAPRLRLVLDGTEAVAWEGCGLCLALARIRGQEETLRRLCREAEKRVASVRNEAALY